jgi:hypothetical protein
MIHIQDMKTKDLNIGAGFLVLGAGTQLLEGLKARRHLQAVKLSSIKPL